MTSSNCSHRTSIASPYLATRWAYSMIALSRPRMKKVSHLNSSLRIIDKTSAPLKVRKTIVSFHRGLMRQFFSNLNSRTSLAYCEITASATNKRRSLSKVDRVNRWKTGRVHHSMFTNNKKRCWETWSTHKSPPSPAASSRKITTSNTRWCACRSKSQCRKFRNNTPPCNWFKWTRRGTWTRRNNRKLRCLTDLFWFHSEQLGMLTKKYRSARMVVTI